MTLGETPQLIQSLARLAEAFGSNELYSAPTLSQAATQAAALINNRRVFMVIDDVWKPEHGAIFSGLLGVGSAILFTTRLPEVAEALAPPDFIYNVPPLSESDAVRLMAMLAPDAMKQYPQEIAGLAADLEYLPLALHVAGRLLNRESKVWDPAALIRQLREGTRLLATKAPQDRLELESQTIPTVAVLLQKSVDHLTPKVRDCFAILGAFAPKPATFDVAALRSAWSMDDPRSVIDELVNRGLLEPVGPGRFQMHALLVLLARSQLVTQ